MQPWLQSWYLKVILWHEKVKITGLDQVDSDIKIYHNGTKNIDGEIYSNGGRVLSIVAVKDTLEEARATVYKNIPKISFENMSYRQDIGLLKNIDS